MCKLKTNRGAAKRFKRTANGYKFKRAFRNHILSKKTTKTKRQLRHMQMVNPSDERMVARMLNDK
jgi:large subunit ribosomal protein L35